MRSHFRRAVFAGFLALACCVGTGAQQITPLIVVDHGPNTAEQQQKHYVVMVSLDGFRYDYAKKYGAKHILEIAKKEASDFAEVQLKDVSDEERAMVRQQLKQHWQRRYGLVEA